MIENKFKFEIEKTDPEYIDLSFIQLPLDVKYNFCLTSRDIFDLYCVLEDFMVCIYAQNVSCTKKMIEKKCNWCYESISEDEEFLITKYWETLHWSCARDILSLTEGQDVQINFTKDLTFDKKVIELSHESTE